MDVVSNPILAVLCVFKDYINVMLP